MKKKFYFDKKNGIILSITVLAVVLPSFVIFTRYCLTMFFFGMDLLILDDTDILGKIFFEVTFRILPIVVLVCAGWFIIFLLKYAYLFLHSITIDEEGIKSKFFFIPLKHLKWDEIMECGIGWEFDRIYQNNKPLPEGIEKFVHSRNINDTHENAVKYIFFSAKVLSETEKLEIFYGQQKKRYLIAVKYSQELYEYLYSSGKLICKDKGAYEYIQKTEYLQDRQTKYDEKFKINLFSDRKTGTLYFIMFFVFLWSALLFVKVIDEYGMSYGVFTFIILLAITVLLLSAAVKYARFAQTCLRVVTVNYEGVKIKRIFGKKMKWSWKQVQDCGVIRDNSSKRARTMIRDQRYIYFSLMPLNLEAGKNLKEQYKRKDVLFVLYSEKLYLYLYELGVINY